MHIETKVFLAKAAIVCMLIWLGIAFFSGDEGHVATSATLSTIAWLIYQFLLHSDEYRAHERRHRCESQHEEVHRAFEMLSAMPLVESVSVLKKMTQSGLFCIKPTERGFVNDRVDLPFEVKFPANDAPDGILLHFSGNVVLVCEKMAPSPSEQQKLMEYLRKNRLTPVFISYKVIQKDYDKCSQEMKRSLHQVESKLSSRFK